MPQQEYHASVEIGGKLDPSLKESFEKFHEGLEKLQEQAKEATEQFKEFTEGIQEFALALFALDEARNVFDWLLDSGREYEQLQQGINTALREQHDLMMKGPEAIEKSRKALEELSHSQDLKGIYGPDISEVIEQKLLAAGIKVKGIGNFLPGIEETLARDRMTGDEAKAAGEKRAESLAKFIQTGKGASSLYDALGISGAEVMDFNKKLQQQQKSEGLIFSPAHLEKLRAEWLYAHVPHDTYNEDARNSPWAQAQLVHNKAQNIADRVGDTLNQSLAGPSRMINIMLGDDATGDNAPLIHLLDKVNEKAKAFDEWVKTDFKNDWANVMGGASQEWNKLVQDVTNPTPSEQRPFPLFTGNLGTEFESMKSTWLQGLADLAKDSSWAEILKDLGEIAKDLNPLITEAVLLVVEDLRIMGQVTFPILKTGLHEIADILDGITAGIRFIQTTTGLMEGKNSPEQVNDAMRNLFEHTKIPFVPDFLQPNNIFLNSLPKKAQGGIATSATAAIVGEAGPEAIVPLSGGDPRLTQAFIDLPDVLGNLADLLGAGGTMPGGSGFNLNSGYRGGGGGGSVGGSGSDWTYYGPGVRGDQPGGPTYDWDSFHGIGHIHGVPYHLVSGLDVAMHPDYATSHYHIRPGDTYISDRDHKLHRWRDTSGARNPDNEDFYKGATININTTIHADGHSKEELAAVFSKHRDELEAKLQKLYREHMRTSYA